MIELRDSLLAQVFVCLVAVVGWGAIGTALTMLALMVGWALAGAVMFLYVFLSLYCWARVTE